MCSFREYPYSPYRRDWNFLGDEGFLKAKNLKKCMKLNWNFQRAGGGIRMLCGQSDFGNQKSEIGTISESILDFSL